MSVNFLLRMGIADEAIMAIVWVDLRIFTRQNSVMKSILAIIVVAKRMGKVV